jgi:superfamily I DNA/RNA helicase
MGPLPPLSGPIHPLPVCGRGAECGHQASGRERQEVTTSGSLGRGCSALGWLFLTLVVVVAPPHGGAMSLHERIRLLYVACTRARDHLVVSLHRKVRINQDVGPEKFTNASS